MPELPEVEIAARVVRACLEGHALDRVTVHDARIVRKQSKAAFRKAVVGRTVRSVDRRG
ncbi:MAG: DNA-formamidopyrimidine glycosylase, partial [Deltaproteobacteria bacterium]|nr:DNA-formamidopyrimidine glycosylase [Deltaproteobacteria bacterium]